MNVQTVDVRIYYDNFLTDDRAWSSSLKSLRRASASFKSRPLILHPGLSPWEGKGLVGVVSTG